MQHYRRRTALADLELVRYPNPAFAHSSRHPLRRAAGVPVLRSAVASKPDWLPTHNTEHFTAVVAKRTTIRIATPADFLRALSSLLR
jgi:hypothetical protein